MAWVSITFFVVEDNGAVMGKRAISMLAGGGSAYVLWRLLTSVRTDEHWLWIAFGLYAYAIGLFYWAWHANRSRPLDFAFSGREPQHFNQSGPYRWIRHPFYSAYCVAWVASWLAIREVGVTLLALLLISTYAIAARREERAFCASGFAEAYQRYRSKTGMFLPRLR